MCVCACVCVTLARCHFKPLRVVQLPLCRNKSHSRFIVWQEDDSRTQRLRERDERRAGLQGAVKWDADDEDGLYLASGRVRVSRTRRR